MRVNFYKGKLKEAGKWQKPKENEIIHHPRIKNTQEENI